MNLKGNNLFPVNGEFNIPKLFITELIAFFLFWFWLDKLDYFILLHIDSVTYYPWIV